MILVRLWYPNKNVYISYPYFFHLLDRALISPTQISLTVIWFMRRKMTDISQVIISILALGLLVCCNSGIILIQKADAAPYGVIISPYYLKQLNVLRQPCIYDVTCMDKFLIPLNPTKNNTFIIINNLPTKIYNTDNVPFELPFP